MRLGPRATAALAGKIEAAAGQEHASDLECSVCTFPALECPVSTVPCGHMFHKTCLEDWLKDKVGPERTCPDCRKELPPGCAYTEVDRRLRAVLDKLNVYCPQECEPNAKRVRYDQLSLHLGQCPKTPLLCGGTGCGVVLPRKEMDTHAAQCEHVRVTCLWCDQKVKRGMLQLHKADDCTHRRFQCLHCKQRNLVYWNKEAHELQCTGSVPMMMVAELRKQNRELQEKQERADANLEGLREQIVQLQRLVQNTQLCRRLQLISKELDAAQGVYEIMPWLWKGHCAWESKDGTSVHYSDGYWGISLSRYTDHRLRVAVGGGMPVAVKGWQVHDGQGWVDAPMTRCGVLQS
eukprot:TRINITY_DN32904_c0_g1_i1.p1 TRINITY_DN32904_c0_g1~~TRINITY_DN32904_c0_g1_i1.p1  ORF type:complete len:381 (+),score=73.36 TRINITY_DN32904_c0_g1_i1:99-1145(+)